MTHISIRHQPDFILGLLYAVAGGGFAFAASRYDMGSLSYMGPGYFPLVLGLVLAFIGQIIMARAVFVPGAMVRLQSWNLRPLIWMVGSVVIFGATLRPLGMVIALVLLVVTASLASREFTWKATLLNAFAMVVVNVGGFVYGLSLPFPLLPSFLDHGI